MAAKEWREALFQSRDDDGLIRCGLCPHGCRLAEGERGLCGVRRVVDGRLVSLVWGRAVALAVDPIEKKPLYHFLPGSGSLSVATVGCNFRCTFCQNHHISQVDQPPPGRGELVTPEQVVAVAFHEGAETIACTYTEPTIYYEYARDIAEAAQQAGLRTIFVTNGYMSPRALDGIRPFLDGANVDLKSFSDETYQGITGGRLAPVLKTIEGMVRAGVWVEVTTLIVPELNDSDRELEQIAAFLADLDPGIPWHISAFHPSWRMLDRGRTPTATIERAVDIGDAAGLQFIYPGNLGGHPRESTRCPGCGAMLIRRAGFTVMEDRLSLPARHASSRKRPGPDDVGTAGPGQAESAPEAPSSIAATECPDCGREIPGRFGQG